MARLEKDQPGEEGYQALDADKGQGTRGGVVNMQPAGKQETTMAAMKVTAIVMVTGNASPPRRGIC